MSGVDLSASAGVYSNCDAIVSFEHAALAQPVRIEQRPDAAAALEADGTCRRLWPAALVLSRYLCVHPELVRGKRVVELGAGAGAVGLVCAALGAQRVVLTDMAEALPLLRDNVARNAKVGGDSTVDVLPCRWGDEADAAALLAGGGFDLVVACEVVYKQDEVVLQQLAQTMSLLAGARGVAMLAYEFRCNLLEDIAYFDAINELFECDSISLRPYEDGDGGAAVPADDDSDDDDSSRWLYVYTRKDAPQGAAAPAAAPAAEAPAADESPTYMLDLLTNYDERTVEYAGEDGGSGPVQQTVLGWSMGGCDTVWSEVLPRLVARHGRRLLSGKTVLELGAGCGLIGMIAANWASRVDITDGDEEEVALISINVAQHAPAAPAPAGASDEPLSLHRRLRAAHLDWARPEAAEPRLLGGRETYDVILASQVVYMPANVPLLAKTLRYFLAPEGSVYLYNDQVALFGTTQAECRALFDRALAAEGLCAEPLQADGHGPLALPPEAVHEMAGRPASYLLHIRRAAG